MEIDILNFIQENFRSGVGDVVFPIITLFGDNGIFWIIVTLLMIIIPKTRKVGIAMAIALAIEAILCNVVIKPLVGRIRPFEVNQAIELLVKKPTDASFPSGHTGASFACAGAMMFSRTKLCIPALILSALIAFSRLYLYVHFPTDVLGGLILGVLCGLFGYLITKSVFASIEYKKSLKTNEQ